MVVYRQDKRQGYNGPDQVAGDHNAFAVKAVKDNPGQRPGQGNRYGSRQHDAAHHQAGVGGGHRQTEHRNVVKVIADLTDDLADPHVAIVAVLA